MEDDAGALARLAEQTFRATFAASNPAENMQRHCESSYGESIQLAEIRDPNLETWLADDGGRLVAAFRSAQTNSMLRQQSRRVAKDSLHVRGRAIDVRLSGRETRRLRDAALSLRQGGVGYYARSNFVHLDTGAVRSW